MRAQEHQRLCTVFGDLWRRESSSSFSVCFSISLFVCSSFRFPPLSPSLVTLPFPSFFILLPPLTVSHPGAHRPHHPLTLAPSNPPSFPSTSSTIWHTQITTKNDYHRQQTPRPRDCRGLIPHLLLHNPNNNKRRHGPGDTFRSSRHGLRANRVRPFYPRRLCGYQQRLSIGLLPTHCP